MSAPITVRDYERAEREVTQEEARRGFRVHATAYALVNLLLLAINLLVVTQTSEDAIWFVFPLVGWGFGLAMHYIFGVRRLEMVITERQKRIERRAQGA
jgi:hypothetical protein